MSDMTPEEQAERIRRLQARRGTAADAPEVRRKRRRKHGVKTRVALTALTLASFGSLVGAMVVGQGSGTTAVASATKTAVAADDSATSSTSGTSGTTGTTSTDTSSASTGTSSTSSSTASSATSGTSSQSSTSRAVTSTKGS